MDEFVVTCPGCDEDIALPLDDDHGNTVFGVQWEELAHGRYIGRLDVLADVADQELVKQFLPEAHGQIVHECRNRG